MFQKCVWVSVVLEAVELWVLVVFEVLDFVELWAVACWVLRFVVFISFVFDLCILLYIYIYIYIVWHELCCGWLCMCLFVVFNCFVSDIWLSSLLLCVVCGVVSVFCLLFLNVSVVCLCDVCWCCFWCCFCLINFLLCFMCCVVSRYLIDLRVLSFGVRFLSYVFIISIVCILPCLFCLFRDRVSCIC